ncbi:major facilitator superfamily domain-containing protein [Delphinella strobiligena]|nr:major facilitator superfamily domain-containing protein [Delphinella strobiligena]
MQALLQYRQEKQRVQAQHTLRIKASSSQSSTTLPTPTHPSTPLDNEKPTTITTGPGTDAANPLTWPLHTRLTTTTLLFLLTTSQGWISASDSNITLPASHTFHVSQTAETLATALFLLGLAAGSPVLGPLSEELGRNLVYLLATPLHLCFQLGAAQISFRFLAGVFSSAALSLYGGSLADLWSGEERRVVWNVFALGPLVSPVLAPVAAGWIEGRVDWRWVYWIGLIFGSAAFVLALAFMPETFSPVLVLWRTRLLRDVTGEAYTCALETRASLLQRLRSLLLLPTRFFCTEMIIVALGAYLVVIYVVIFTFLNGMQFIFQDTSGLSSGIASLAFVGIAVGALVATVTMPLFGVWRRRLLRRRRRIRGGPGPAELLLLPAMVAAPLYPMSLLRLGWTNTPSISYWSGYGATVLFGYSMTNVFVSSYIYIIDSYGSWGSSALGSITLARYLVSGGMVVASRPMYQGIGVR